MTTPQLGVRGEEVADDRVGALGASAAPPEPIRGVGETASSVYFQVYVDAVGNGGHWRLLSGNHRELGRSVTEAETFGELLLDIRQIKDRLDRARLVVRPVGGHRWEWRLIDDAGTLAVSGHAFDRKVRCLRAADQFVALGGSAPVAPHVIATGSRRGTRPGRRPV